jgi:hypothetical protein
MKVLVCGGRHYDNWNGLLVQLDDLHGIYGFTELIHGGAPGADTLANTWAAISGVPVKRFIAFWQTEGKAAGPRRNKRMLDYGPDLVVAFPGGKGTADMIAQAEKAGVTVINISLLTGEKYEGQKARPQQAST